MSKDEQITKLRSALMFYSATANYMQGGWQGDPDPSPVSKDNGTIARAALKETTS